MKHLLPCECGLHIPVDVGQAGQMVACKCGQVVEVPTMRQIRQLPIVQLTDSQEKTPWSRAQGILFASGMGITVLALVVASICWYYRTTIEEFTKKPVIETESETREFNALIDKMSGIEFRKEWDKFTKNGLGEWREHYYIALRRRSTLFYNCTISALAVAALAASIGICPIFLKPKKRKTKALK